MPGQAAWPVNTSSERQSGRVAQSCGQPSRAAQSALVATQCASGNGWADSSVPKAWRRRAGPPGDAAAPDGGAAPAAGIVGEAAEPGPAFVFPGAAPATAAAAASAASASAKRWNRLIQR